jgi:2-desacetyl-2-hydroxyethyl bacteriochlorophyllide A dehydrogenase
MNGLALQFTAPYRVSVIEEPVASPGTGQVLVRASVSAISPGTELLIYRGEWPENLPVDETIPALAGKFAFPLKYGYATVGTVSELGTAVANDWLGKRVFAFHPHQSHFLARPEHLIVLPDSLSAEGAAFLPNMETAVSFLMDGHPMIGERTVVFGQGVVGLLTTSLLAGMSQDVLVTLDRYPIRREKSLQQGATESLDPADTRAMERVADLLHMGGWEGGADLIYELSGNPEALNHAVSLAGFGGRIVVGSWYGSKRSDLDLGGRFHRGRIRLLSSQVSRIAPELSGLWTKARRLRYAMQLLVHRNPEGLVTHRFPLYRAAEAYATLHERPEQAIQVLLTYEDPL